MFSSFLIISWPSEMPPIITVFSSLFYESLAQFSYIPSSVLISWFRTPISFCPDIIMSHSISLKPSISFPQTPTHIDSVLFSKDQNHRIIHLSFCLAPTFQWVTTSYWFFVYKVSFVCSSPMARSQLVSLPLLCYTWRAEVPSSGSFLFQSIHVRVSP